MERLLTTMRRLRGPGGCPWDREQDHLSLRPYLLEEACEAMDAIASGSSAEMAGELGDVLLQVAFHAVIAEEAGTFGYDDIESSIVAKLVRRHPHVFGDVRADTPAQVLANWQALKAEEGHKPGVPRSLPALMRAQELGKKLGWPEGSFQGIEEALKELEDEPSSEQLGELLLAVVAYARTQGIQAELALREAAARREAEGAFKPR
jgi:XTP/dITP diphosphohydrolase